MERFDVAVVGAGLAGLETARLLGRRGLRVLLADRKTAVDREVHTTGIFVRRTLEDFVLPADCLGPPVRRVTLYSPARRPLTLESPHPEFRVGRMGLLYRSLLEQCRMAGVEWSPATRYVGGSPAGEGTAVRLLRDGRAVAVLARFVVGADGARSRVARDLGLDANRRWIAGLEEVFDGVPLEGPPLLAAVEVVSRHGDSSTPLSLRFVHGRRS